MKLRNILYATVLLACTLQTTVPTQENVLAQLKKSIVQANLEAFETTFNAHVITSEEKLELSQVARATHLKLQTECDSLGDRNSNIATCVTGVVQGVGCLWALYNAFKVGATFSYPPHKKEPKSSRNVLIVEPGMSLFPGEYLAFIFTRYETAEMGKQMIVRFANPTLDQQLPRFWAGCALSGVSFGALTVYLFHKAVTNISRGLNYKRYLKTKISNLDIMLEYLA